MGQWTYRRLYIKIDCIFDNVSIDCSMLGYIDWLVDRLFLSMQLFLLFYWDKYVNRERWCVAYIRGNV